MNYISNESPDSEISFDIKFFWFWPRNVFNVSGRMRASVLRCKNSFSTEASIRCHGWLCVVQKVLVSLLTYLLIEALQKSFVFLEIDWILIFERLCSMFSCLKCRIVVGTVLNFWTWEIFGFFVWSPKKSFDWEHDVETVRFRIKSSTFLCIQFFECH
jgi:hypothetical protein